MKRKPVQSSAIVSIGYDEEKELLEVEFTESHDVYHYFDVTPEIHEELMNAKSIGAYFNRHVKFHHEEYKVNT